MENRTQLNGWFGKLLKGLLTALAGKIDSYTFGVFDLENRVHFSMTNDYFVNRLATEEPSPAEEIVLRNWNTAKFAPFCANLGKRILDMQNSSTAVEQIEILNEINLKMCVVRSYFLSNELTGLLQVGRDTRTDLIDEAFLLLIGIMQPIIEALGATSTEITASSFGDDFGNLIPEYYNIQPTVCDRYSTNNVNVAPVNVTAIIQENQPVNTTQTQPTNNTPAAPDDKPSPLKKILVLTGVTALLYWALGDDDNKN